MDKGKGKTIGKQAVIDAAAKEFFGEICGHRDWEISLPSVKAFYRKIARWHLSYMQRCDHCGRINEERHWVCTDCFVKANQK